METILMMQRRFAFLAVAGAIVLASCGGAEQGDKLPVQRGGHMHEAGIVGDKRIALLYQCHGFDQICFSCIV